MSYLVETVSRLPVLLWMILPFVAASLVAVGSVFWRRKKIVFFLYGLILTFFAGAVALHSAVAAKSAFAFACILAFFITLLSPLSLLSVPKKEKPVAEKKSALRTEAMKALSPEPFLPAAAPLPPKEKEGGMPAVKDDIQLEHVFRILKKLQTAKLSSGDRLETDVIYNSLVCLQAKENLTPEETRRVNDHLATLLKLMSRYSL